MMSDELAVLAQEILAHNNSYHVCQTVNKLMDRIESLEAKLAATINDRNELAEYAGKANRRAELAARPNHTVRLWVAPTITGRLWIFTEKPTVRGELSWLNDGDRYPWIEALFGIPPVMTWDDDPVEIEVSWRVLAEEAKK
jgi:hypothetical protein